MGSSAEGQDLVPFGSPWEYFHPTDGVDPAIADSDFNTTWHTPTAYDGPVFDGPAPAMLGYGEIALGSITTNIGTPPRGERYTAYFRTSFTVSQAYDYLRIDILADDGGLLYIDGELIQTLNFSGSDNFFASADGAGNETWTTVFVLNERLEAGEHVIAFSVHNSNPASSDLGFDLQITPLNQPGSVDYLAWTVDAGEVTIRGVAESVVGHIEIPDFIEGFPVTRINSSAFRDCHGLTSVVIPDGVTEIGSSAFENCSGLTSVTIPVGVTSIAPATFENCISLTSVVIPEGVLEIGQSAFDNCRDLTSVTIPDGVTSISRFAFRNCDSLASIVIPDSVVGIGSGLFESCGRLTSVVISEGLTHISSGTFKDCVNLTGVVIPDSVVSIGISSFEYTQLTELVIPDSVTEIAREAFLGCDDLTSLVIGNGIQKIDTLTFSGCSGLTSVTIPDNITTIGYEAFSGCESLVSLTIGNGVTVIGSGAFSYCTALTSVTIPDNVEVIASLAFSDCHLLSEVSLGLGLETIGSWAFLDTQVTFQASGDFKYITSPVAAFLVDGGSASGDLDLSATYNGLPVRSITFQNIDTITSVIIPSSVRRIGASAFKGCSNLVSVTMPNSVSEVGGSAFRDCEALTSVTIPGSVTEIGSYAFDGCRALTSVVIPGSVASISNHLFNSCRALTSVTILDGVTSIGLNAFEDCIALTSVVIPGSVTSIGNFAFHNCKGLMSVVIPSSVTSIGGYAFLDCTSLASVTFTGAPPASVSLGSFEGVPSDAQVLVTPEHVQSFGGVGTNWYGLVVVLAPDPATQVSVTLVSLNGNDFEIRFIGDPEVSDWRVVGTSDLSDFSDAPVVVTEIAPGVYEAVIDVSNNLDHYFFRVER